MQPVRHWIARSVLALLVMGMAYMVACGDDPSTADYEQDKSDSGNEGYEGYEGYAGSGGSGG